MSEISAAFNALRGVKPTHAPAADPIEQFRADFKAMFRYWRRCGQMSEDEFRREYETCARGIQQNVMRDPEAFVAAMAHFREMAAAIDADQAWADGVREKTRAERAQKTGAAA